MQKLPMLQSGNKKNNQLMQYAAMGTQLTVALLLSVWLGMKLDKWLKFIIPIFVWALPLVIIIAFIVKLIRDTFRKNNSK